jgi:sugar phosphate isomerase/epimerase
MNLSMTTDYVKFTGDPLPYLGRIARAGFTHVHWCHEWCTSHFYEEEEVNAISRELDQLGLRLLDLHAPHGMGDGWGSSDDGARNAALALVMNRMNMTAALGGDAVVLHLPRKPADPSGMGSWRVNVRKSLDSLAPLSRSSGVRIALENIPDDDFSEIGALLTGYDGGFLGICYDSGHGNLGRDGLQKLAFWKARLISVHLHDNDGKEDTHRLPFTGTVDWKRLSVVIAGSSYEGCVSLESNMRGMEVTEERYLGDACRAATRVGRMIEEAAGKS